jgi:hypothetical protein
VKRLVVLFAVACLAGCGGGGHGQAQLWITRDEGRQIILVTTVPAGLTAMQALDRKTKIETRYGGRFVQSIDGLSGSLGAQRDWFYYVNGYEGDRSAAEYRLHDGDVEWWDYRSWRGGREHIPVVVGAFPEPFVHGWNGKTRPTIVLGPRTPAVRQIAKLVHARRVVSTQTTLPRGMNTLTIVPAPVTRFTITVHGGPGGPVDALFLGDPRRLAAQPPVYRYRYRVG